MRMLISCLGLLFFFVFKGVTQEIMPTRLEVYQVNVNWDKTTVLIFPKKVVSADFGNSSIIAERDAAVPRVLKLKASSREFKPTTMYVLCEDEKFYPFEVSYSDSIDSRPIDFQYLDGRKEGGKRSLPLKFNDEEVDFLVNHLKGEKEESVNWKITNALMRMGISGIYVGGGFLFFKLSIENRSGIDWNLESGKVYVKDKIQTKRTAVRDVEKQPFKWGKPIIIPGNEKENSILVMEQFTIADRKEFLIELSEKNGDRNLKMRISGRNILRADNISID